MLALQKTVYKLWCRRYSKISASKKLYLEDIFENIKENDDICNNNLKESDADDIVKFDQVFPSSKQLKKQNGTKWKFLEHKGPVFAPRYEPLPDHIKLIYDGKEMNLSKLAEEVATFYVKLLDHDFNSKNIFNTNFFEDWKKTMTPKERAIITDLKKCNFKLIHAYFKQLNDKNKNLSKEDKLKINEKNEAIAKEYGFCSIDGIREKVGNYKIEPPGLFRGRGEHPKMGKLKKRIQPEDVIINCSRDSKIPQPPSGHKWKEVRHDSTVCWLASWTENVQNKVKYITLNSSSRLKGENDFQKYETARRLHTYIDKIRMQYREAWNSNNNKRRQLSVALYLIDNLAIRAGNEKDENEADTVGCCSLRVEHIKLHKSQNSENYSAEFDFLGKDCIRYHTQISLEKPVFDSLQSFMENKKPNDSVFDQLNIHILNRHLNELMEGLTSKVFRTYNASRTLQEKLEELTNPNGSIEEKILAYNRANCDVAVLCNHQISIPKNHKRSLEKLKEKIEQKVNKIQYLEEELTDVQSIKNLESVKEKGRYERRIKRLQKMTEQLNKMKIQETIRDQNKRIDLNTSKLNYLDPRITVAWCKKFQVPIEKIYSKTQRDKFKWALDMVGPNFQFE